MTRMLKDMRLAWVFIFSGDYSLTTTPVAGDYKTSTKKGRASRMAGIPPENFANSHPV